MPQLDKYIFFDQLVLTMMIFIFFYILNLQYILPKIVSSLKFRRFYLYHLTFELSFIKYTYDLRCKFHQISRMFYFNIANFFSHGRLLKFYNLIFRQCLVKLYRHILPLFVVFANNSFNKIIYYKLILKQINNIHFKVLINTKINNLLCLLSTELFSTLNLVEFILVKITVLKQTKQKVILTQFIKQYETKV